MPYTAGKGAFIESAKMFETRFEWTGWTSDDPCREGDAVDIKTIMWHNGLSAS